LTRLKVGGFLNLKCVNEWIHNVVYQQFRAMYDSGYQICCNWSRLKVGFLNCQHT